MSIPKLVRKTLAAVLGSPILQAFGVSDVYNVLRNHFQLTAAEMTLAYQKSYSCALTAIAAGLASEAQWQSFWQKITNSQVEREFAGQIVAKYLLPFANQLRWDEAELAAFRHQALQTCQALANQYETLFQIAPFELTDDELAALVNETEIASLSALVLEYIQSVPETKGLLTDSVEQFLVYDNLLGHALLFFLQEELRNNKRFNTTLSHLRQQGLLVEVRNWQSAEAEFKASLDNKLTTIEQQLAAQNQQLIQAASQTDLEQAFQQKQVLLSEQQALADMPARLQQAQANWQAAYGEFIQFSEQFSDWSVLVGTQLTQVLQALSDLQYQVEQIDRKVEQIDRKVEQILQQLKQWGKQLEVSAQIKPRDEFTQYSGVTEVKIRSAIAQFKKLPNYLDHSEAALYAGSLSSALGDLKVAEQTFIDIVKTAKNSRDKALAYFNLFQLYLRRGAEFYDPALKYLNQAIELERAYLLHNVDRFPMERILGAGGMGCVILCHDPLAEERLQKEQFVVVKCLWESQRGEPKQIFAEALRMARIAGDSVPKPLDYGYVDTHRQERAFFVTEFVDNAMDGEAWLTKQGPMKFSTGLEVGLQVAEGLQKAHQHGILHLDLKPANLLLLTTSKTVSVKIIDFGLARMATSLRQHAALTQARAAQSQLAQQIFGTFDYAPPEQWGDLEYRLVTEKSDVFALGKTLYRLFTGQRPQHNIRRKYLPEASAELHELLEDCVESNPADRPTVAEVVERLSVLISEKPVFEFEIVTVNANGKIIAREPKTACYETEDLGNGVTLDMVYIPGGTFMMGSPEDEEERWDNEGPQHEVTIKPFWMAKYLVTQAQWQAVMGDNRSYFKGDNRPVERVSWNDCVKFCQQLSEKTGKSYHLPSEAQWEYACRAGTTTPFYFGPTITTDLANYCGNYTYASEPKGVYREETTDVGRFPPNAFGLYNMHGNLWEWTGSEYEDKYQGKELLSLTSVDSGSRLAFRGGSWNGIPGNVRAADRFRNSDDNRNVSVGFRLARSS